MSEWAEQPPGNAQANPGAQLKTQREALGWSVEQVAEQLKLAKRQVIALEAGDYAALPGTAVVRGFIRAYAKVVKLDAAPLVAMIEPDPPEPNDATAVRREKPASFSEVRFPTHGERPFPIAIVIVGALVLAGIFAAYEFGLVPSHLPSVASSASSAAAQAPAPVVEKPVEPPVETTLLKADQELRPVQRPDALVSVASATSPEPAPVAAAPAAAQPAPAPAAAPVNKAPATSTAPAAATTTTTNKPAAQGATALTPAPAPAKPAAAPVVAAPAAAAAAAKPATPGANALVFNVRQDSWIEVRRVSNNTSVFQRLAKAGSTETVEVTEPVNIVVGKPESVDATLRGSALELKPQPGLTTARLSVK
jgi:cytoskeleton protein RodZ